ncbi:HlyD family secretion protein [Methylovirgula sp. HY1]|uniref:HlyD family secretion protein n=1 Tax=Methylovirgula sp. HY1 TaxID=2822761 RepID=UPI001C5A6653|nr:HlyD family efflux transporter periplasmic adaptor subunit [Methylovirgula sp. HY1]QXX74012.1 Colicin V secretion protein CvaA [Methylovirgula sp. HY1]
MTTPSRTERAGTALFRDEVMHAERNGWIGPAQLVQPLPIHLVTAATIVLLIAAALFAYFGTYTRRVHAAGIVMPTAGLITVASSAAGVVTSMAVREGDQVKKGALLYVINRDTHSSDGATEQQVIAELMRQKANLESQRNIRKGMAKVEKQGLADQRSNLQKQYGKLGEQIAIEGKAVAIQKAKAAALQNGVKNGFIRDSEFQNQNYLYVQTLSQQTQFEQAYLQTAGRIFDLDQQIALFDEKLAQDLNGIDQQLLHLDQLITEAEAKRTIEIGAPESGTATSNRVHVGQQVAAGAPLLTLLPKAGKLSVDLFVDSRAIGFVGKGAPVILRYAAYPFQRFGLYRGTVKEVTRAPVEASPPDQLPGVGADAQAANDPRAGLYRILVTPQTPYVMAYGKPRLLEAGMRVDADIALERRPLYRWLFDPLYHLQRSATLVSSGGLR